MASQSAHSKGISTFCFVKNRLQFLNLLDWRGEHIFLAECMLDTFSILSGKTTKQIFNTPLGSTNVWLVAADHVTA